jgi:hypothetical protein
MVRRRDVAVYLDDETTQDASSDDDHIDAVTGLPHAGLWSRRGDELRCDAHGLPSWGH